MLRIMIPVVVVLLGVGALTTAVRAQEPPDRLERREAIRASDARRGSDESQTRSVQRPAQYIRDPFPPAPTDPEHPEYYGPAHRSVLRQSPMERYGEVPDSRTAGYRNPGGVGRYREFYPAGDQFQSGGHDPVHVATFNQQTYALSRQAQLQAYNAGTARYNAIQTHIDRYGRPMGFWGIGWGGGAFFGFPAR